VVEAISDPLVHMVRNSIDHGVEKPEDREKAGKPRAGRVVLKACHQSGNVVVQITDDGRGLNTQRIVQKAIAAGIVKEGQELTEQQIFQLIFHPGLSTAEKITDISGRGVGMDVVRKNVELFKVEPKNTDPTHALVVIVQDGPDLCCLLVDELVGQQQVVIKSVGKEIGELPGIAGCAILGDGNVSLILDIGGIIHSALK
jgi:chemotaxis protein histidine kinase CheA